LQRLSELLIPLIGKTLVLASPRETLKVQQAAWMTENKPPNVSGTYSLVPGIAGADFANDGDGVTLDTKVALINRVFKCVFRTPLAATVKGEFHTLLFNSSMDRLLAAHRSAKGVELGMWSNEPATWHGTGVLLDKLDEGWHTLSLASIKNLSCIYLDGTCSPSH